MMATDSNQAATSPPVAGEPASSSCQDTSLTGAAISVASNENQTADDNDKHSTSCETNQTSSNKRKLDENDDENNRENNNSNNIALDEASAQQLRLKLTDTLKRSLVLAKLEKLKEIHNECIQFVNEEHYLKSQLAYIDYPKWSRQQAQQPACESAFLTANKQKLAELEARAQVGKEAQAPAAVPVTTVAKVTPPSKQSIAERARHEANILQRIAKLRKEGLWSIKRLPKLVEPARPKTHWDYLLDEMLWMSTDFQQERKWKINCSKKISLAIQKYFKDKQARVELAEKEELKRVRKQASLISREIQVFWRNVEKIIEYKQNTLLEEKRKHVMDMHLKIIVNQTEKYSNWLMESLNQRKEEDQSSSSIAAADDDKEFQLNEKMIENLKDDESTIEEEEKNLFYENNKAIDDELEKLRLESELPLDDLLKDYNLDSSYFNNALANNNENKNKSTEKRKATESSEDEEEGENDEENEEEEEEDDTMLTDDEDEEEDDEEEMMEDVELDELVKSNDAEDAVTTNTNETTSATTMVASEGTGTDQVLTSIAETAQSFQPTGYTLETTNVKTKVPSLLLKHDLREYQHVGLDWLVTMYENKLNGILADEMGLGKTIQTIALLAHLAQEKFIWGPHLIVVPTSVILNWELEFKKWAPGFKILTYYGSTKERRVKRQGWTKMNAFHVCITSYKLVIQDHAAFRRKKWKYFILDEAQNIKNFKSQRWQSLLNFQSQRRLLLTGTPLQNNLMELWSLMHFLMPHVFSSHKEFQHWFSNPLNCMIEGNTEYNEQLIKRLHKVLRPFILRRLKSDVEKQMPKKYEHVIRCKLSKRQRYLYDEFMSLASTKEKLEQGNYISVINILMQLRKVCNHPDLFESRPIVSSYVCEPHTYSVPSCVFNLADELTGDKLENLLFYQSSMSLCDMEFVYSAFACHRSKRLQTPRKLIEEIMVNVPQLPITQSSYFSNSSYSLLYSNLVQPAASQPLDSQADQGDVDPLDDDKYFLQTTMEGVESNRLKKCVKQQPANSNALKSKIQYLVRTNRQRCSFTKPMYGLDLHECVTIEPRATTKDTSSVLYRLTHLAECTDLKLELTDVLNKFVLYIPSVVYSVKRAFDSYENNYVKLNVKHPNVSQYSRQKVLIEQLNTRVRQRCPQENRLLNMVELNQTTQFPEKRLIEYDCGKLQTMSTLLRRLYTESHRVLIFTQMTRMLDVLENFLNYHGYKYLRLDGSTGIEKRQCLMERFNNDKRIFCMILSTRSGGIGVNLTGADTVVFYDSDWNPTMDAQAQDRCHRIGQTRDVNIYRLISDKTIEENILRKANQKRLLNEMTIEGGCFTTALLKRNFITELFDDSPAELSVQVNSPQVANAPVTVSPQPPSPTQANESTTTKEAEIEFEKVLALVEDESDVKAAKELQEEVKADCAEFDENEAENNNQSVNNENDESIRKKYDDRVENEFKSIEQQLKPIERYALKFLETYGDISLVREDEQEMEIEKVKQDWELNRLKRLKEEEERKAELDDDDMMIYTYTKAELWCPLTPPINEETDVYIDNDEETYSYLYDNEPIAESLLPPVYTKRGDKRVKLVPTSPVKKLATLSTSQTLTTTPPSSTAQTINNLLAKSNVVTPPSSSVSSTSAIISSIATVAASVSAVASGVSPVATIPTGALSASVNQTINTVVATTQQSSQSKMAKLDNIIIVPRPVFDKTNTALIKLRRDIKMQKLKGWPTYKLDLIRSTLPVQPEMNYALDDWMPNDDFLILFTLQIVLELPLNLQTIAPAHQTNWDLVSDIVSSGYSKHFRSAFECRKRFENIILKREELCLSEMQNKKQQQLQLQMQHKQQEAQSNSQNKSKQNAKPVPLNICKTKTLRTNQLFVQDNYRMLTQSEKHRFEKIAQIAKKRQSTFSFSYVPITNRLNQTNIPYQQVMKQQHDVLLGRYSPASQPHLPTNTYSSTVLNAASFVACKHLNLPSNNANNNPINIPPEIINFKTPKLLADLKQLRERQPKVTAQPQPPPQPQPPVATQAPAQPQSQQPQLQPQVQSQPPVVPAVPTSTVPEPVAPSQFEPTQPGQPSKQMIQSIQNKLQQHQQQQQLQQQQQQQQQSNKNQTILHQLQQQQQQQQKATSALAAQLAASAAAVGAQEMRNVPQPVVYQQQHAPQQTQVVNKTASPQSKQQQKSQPVTTQQQTVAASGQGSTIYSYQQQPGSTSLRTLVQTVAPSAQPQQAVTTNSTATSFSQPTIAVALNPGSPLSSNLLLPISSTTGATIIQQQQQPTVTANAVAQATPSGSQTISSIINNVSQASSQPLAVNQIHQLSISSQQLQHQPQIQQHQSQPQTAVQTQIQQQQQQQQQSQQSQQQGQQIRYFTTSAPAKNLSQSITDMRKKTVAGITMNQATAAASFSNQPTANNVSSGNTITSAQNVVQANIQTQSQSQINLPNISSQTTTTSVPTTSGGQQTIKQLAQQQQLQQQKRIAEQLNKSQQQQQQQQQQAQQQSVQQVQVQAHQPQQQQAQVQQSQPQQQQQQIHAVQTQQHSTNVATLNQKLIQNIPKTILTSSNTVPVSVSTNTTPQSTAVLIQQQQQQQQSQKAEPQLVQVQQQQPQSVVQATQQAQSQNTTNTNLTNKPQTSFLIRQHSQIQQLTANKAGTGSSSTSSTVESLIKSQPISKIAQIQSQQQQQPQQQPQQQEQQNMPTITKITAPTAIINTSALSTSTSNAPSSMTVTTASAAPTPTQPATTTAAPIATATLTTTNSGVSTSASTTSNATPLTTLIKPINSVTLSLQSQQNKPGIITNQPQQFRQFQLVTTGSSNAQGGSTIQQPTTQLVIQQPNQSSVNQQTTIRKVGSSSNLANFQSKVQVVNRTGIQIVQAANTTRITKPTTGPTSISTTQITAATQSPAIVTASGTNASTIGSNTSTSAATSTSTPASIQIQQVTPKVQTTTATTSNPSISSTSINLQTLGAVNTGQANVAAGTTSNTTSSGSGPSSSSFSSLMNALNNSNSSNPVVQTKSQTVKAIFANSSSVGSNSSQIISITPTGINSQNLHQAVPININSSLSQVLRQITTGGSSVSIQPINSNIYSQTPSTTNNPTATSANSTTNENKDTGSTESKSTSE